MAEGTYRDIIGVVAFPVEETTEVAGQVVQKFTVRTIGTKDQSQLVGVTLWPSHKAFFGKIEKGDVLALQGKYAVRTGTKDGEPTKYHNLSVTGILKLGALDNGEKVETTDAGSGDGDDEAW